MINFDDNEEKQKAFEKVQELVYEGGDILSKFWPTPADAKLDDISVQEMISLVYHSSWPIPEQPRGVEPDEQEEGRLEDAARLFSAFMLGVAFAAQMEIR
jgi:hypothetical protein